MSFEQQLQQYIDDLCQLHEVITNTCDEIRWDFNGFIEAGLYALYLGGWPCQDGMEFGYTAPSTGPLIEVGLKGKLKASNLQFTVSALAGDTVTIRLVGTGAPKLIELNKNDLIASAAFEAQGA